MIKNALTAAAIASLALFSAGCTTTASTTTPPAGRDAAGSGPLSPEAKRDIGEGYRDTLTRLYDTTPGSRELVAKAAGVLVFPHAVSAGFVVGGEYGNGELRVGNKFNGYYRTTTGSIGLQIGMQSRAIVFLFMTQDSLNKFLASKGWSVGADASVAVLKVGANGAVDAGIAQSPTIAFMMTNGGLMANLSFEGTKVTKIE